MHGGKEIRHVVKEQIELFHAAGEGGGQLRGGAGAVVAAEADFHSEQDAVQLAGGRGGAGRGERHGPVPAVCPLQEDRIAEGLAHGGAHLDEGGAAAVFIRHALAEEIGDARDGRAARQEGRSVRAASRQQVDGVLVAVDFLGEARRGAAAGCFAAGPSEAFAQNHAELLLRDRLEQVVGRAELHGRADQAVVLEAADDDDLSRVAQLAELFHHLRAGAQRHFDVGENQLDGPGADGLDRFLAVFGLAGDESLPRFAAVFLEKAAELAADHGVVVHDENVAHGCAHVCFGSPF